MEQNMVQTDYFATAKEICIKMDSCRNKIGNYAKVGYTYFRA